MKVEKVNAEEVEVSQEVVLSKICEIRGERVMLEKDLAALYEIETEVLMRAIRRNTELLSVHFMFELSRDENEALRPLSIILKREKEEIRHLPIAFTEHGILQVANVLRSKKVKYISVRITEIFIETRKRILTHESLSVEIDKLRKQVGEHDKEIDLFLEY